MHKHAWDKSLIISSTSKFYESPEVLLITSPHSIHWISRSQLTINHNLQRKKLLKPALTKCTINTHLLSQNFIKSTGIPQVYPFSLSPSLLIVLSLTRNNPVESFGARNGRAQPDLLIWWLLVENISSVRWENERKNTSLCRTFYQ